ncbi:uncharacterized protein LOC133564858 [Nerophis ophidion]|uniref:uncharacterized protein LOC133564858 n=1 Tax=Nerophis ophidion TaxID=159077 RepID=UPI002ADF0A0C|nr:uncharacterized protein LOC133564858 [Nerophis ophidion]
MAIKVCQLVGLPPQNSFVQGSIGTQRPAAIPASDQEPERDGYGHVGPASDRRLARRVGVPNNLTRNYSKGREDTVEVSGARTRTHYASRDCTLTLVTNWRTGRGSRRRVDGGIRKKGRRRDLAGFARSGEESTGFAKSDRVATRRLGRNPRTTQYNPQATGTNPKTSTTGRDRGNSASQGAIGTQRTAATPGNDQEVERDGYGHVGPASDRRLATVGVPNTLTRNYSKGRVNPALRVSVTSARIAYLWF